MLGDRDELIRVFENLVENALKYAASGKRVDIGLALAEGGARRARGTGRRCATMAPASRPSICRA